MTAGGSQQLRLYRINRREGATMATACAVSGLSLAEARMWEAADAESPPPEEAFQLLNTTQSPGTAAPEIAGLQRLHAGRDCSAPSEHPASLAPRNHQQQENDMAHAKKQDAPISGEVPKPDYELGIRIFRNDIKPAKAKQAEHSQEQSQAYKELKNHANLNPSAAKVAFSLDSMEESKRDDWLRTFQGLLRGLKIFMPRDLVDQAEGKGVAHENVVPIGDRPALQLATIPMSDGVDDDLAGNDSHDDDNKAEAAE